MQLITDAEYETLNATMNILETWRKKSEAAIASAPDASVERLARRTHDEIRAASEALDMAIGALTDPQDEIVMNEDGKTGRVYYGGILRPDLVATLIASVVLGSSDDDCG